MYVRPCTVNSVEPDGRLAESDCLTMIGDQSNLNTYCMHIKSINRWKIILQGKAFGPKCGRQAVSASRDKEQRSQAGILVVACK